MILKHWETIDRNWSLRYLTGHCVIELEDFGNIPLSSRSLVRFSHFPFLYLQQVVGGRSNGAGSCFFLVDCGSSSDEEEEN